MYHFAVFCPYVPTTPISALISVKTDLDSRNEDSSWTALMSAARSGHYEVVGLLVEAGADLTLQDSRGLTALDLARRFGYTKIVNFLSKLGCEITPKNDDNTNLTPAQDANLEK
jgi:ankyrin repeat protein